MYTRRASMTARSYLPGEALEVAEQNVELEHPMSPRFWHSRPGATSGRATSSWRAGLRTLAGDLRMIVWECWKGSRHESERLKGHEDFEAAREA